MAEIAVVIDTDPGIDDAVAILFALASGRFDIRGVTTVAGNLGIGVTTKNAGRILAFAGRPDIPVVAGVEQASRRNGPEGTEIHGEDGLGGVPFPHPQAAPLAQDAAAWLAQLLLREPPGTIDVLALGPLGNIARLIQEAPEAARRIRRLVAMGGAVNEPGNVGPHAEFNLAIDPQAAERVFRAGLPLTLIPLDVTRRVRADLRWCDALAASELPVATVAARLVRAYFLATRGRESRPLHDPCVMLFALRPDLFSCEGHAFRVDTADGPDAGALIRDPGGSEISVAMRVDAPAALALLADGLTRRES